MTSLLTALVCPTCKSVLQIGGDLLNCPVCVSNFPVLRGIPRFVPSENYADSFGLQWNRFARTQLDSALGTNRSKNRFIRETLWNAEQLKGKLVLDAGCGSGRFSEIALGLGARLIAIDYSSAVDAASENLNSDNLLIAQGDLAILPIPDESLDFIYCIGVLQHTRNPERIVAELLRCLKPGGEITLTFYENSSWHVRFYAKYLIRPVTKRLPNKFLLNFIDSTSSVWFPVTNLLFRLPGPLSRFFRFIIPIANYVEFSYARNQDARAEAILDTFDMLSPSFDRPIKKIEILQWISASKIEVSRLEAESNPGTMRFKRI
ncbi:MAG: methyltransferase domain-containing protein [Candidatus Planktophila sp.]|nr:methyltransferase domain-containing protein [Candidatus Planktophila sp.]